MTFYLLSFFFVCLSYYTLKSITKAPNVDLFEAEHPKKYQKCIFKRCDEHPPILYKCEFSPQVYMYVIVNKRKIVATVLFNLLFCLAECMMESKLEYERLPIIPLSCLYLNSLCDRSVHW